MDDAERKRLEARLAKLQGELAEAQRNFAGINNIIQQRSGQIVEIQRILAGAED